MIFENVLKERINGSPGVRNGQSSTPRATTSDINGDADDIAALNAAIAQATADNAELEDRAKTVKLKAELHALHQRNAHLQSQAAARPDLAPGERVQLFNCLLIITNFTESNIHCPQLAG